MNANKVWNQFLDSTPRQWGQALRECVRLRIALPHPSRRSLGTICVVASLAVHAVAFGALLFRPAGASFLGKGDRLEVEMRTNPHDSAEVDAVYDEQSEIVIPRAKPKKPRTAAERLLDKYRGLHVAKSDPTRPAATAKTTPGADARPLLVKPLAVLPARDVVNPAGLSRDEINQHLSHYQTRFQACYERALLQDQSLNGKVAFALKTGPEGGIADSQIQFEGHGLPETRRELQDCLRRVTQQIQFPKSLTAALNRTIQFQAVLSL